MIERRKREKGIFGAHRFDGLNELMRIENEGGER